MLHIASMLWLGACQKHITGRYCSSFVIRGLDFYLCFKTFADDCWFFLMFQVALKTLIVIHRALREVEQTFHEEVINYSRSRTHMLNMSHFKDDSSPNGTTTSCLLLNFLY